MKLRTHRIFSVPDFFFVVIRNRLFQVDIPGKS